MRFVLLTTGGLTRHLYSTTKRNKIGFKFTEHYSKNVGFVITYPIEL